jgi:MscS family membrane protein
MPLFMLATGKSDSLQIDAERENGRGRQPDTMFKRKRWYLGACALSLGMLGCTAPSPQSGPSGATPTAAAPQTEPPRDSLGRTTPSGTVLGFLSAARAGDDELASRYLNTKLRGANAALLARHFFVVLNRGMPARLNQISDSPAGSLSDSLPLDRDLVGTITTAQGKVDVLVERVDVDQGAPGSVWLFSADTLAAVPDLYAEFGAPSRPERWFPRLVRTRIAGVTLFEWLVIVVGMPLLYLLTALPIRLLRPLTAPWRRRFLSETATTAMHPDTPVRLLLLVLVIHWLNLWVGASLGARQLWADTAAAISIAAIVWLLVVLNAWGEQYIRWRLRDRNLAGIASVVRLGRWGVDVLVIVAGVFAILHHFGVNPTAALAGLGVGGIAVALAAQKTLENVIAGISLILDQAVRVGDFLKAGDCRGTVDHIGLRSTWIRTLDRTLVSVPNSQIANMSLETVSARDKYWFHPLIRLRCETTVDQIRCVVDGVRSLLEKHPAVERGSVRVSFLGFGSTSLDVDVHAYVFGDDWKQFLETQEVLLFGTMEIVQEAGASRAVPPQINCLAGYPADSAAVAGTQTAATNSPPTRDLHSETT